MRKAFFLIFSLFILLLSACSSEKDALDERINTFFDLWNKEDFSKMYELLSSNSKAEYPKDEFIDHYEKIYNDLKISNLEITYKKLDKKALKEVENEKKVNLPISVSMDSLAGPISFNYEATFILEDNDKSQFWGLEWDLGYIFPELKNGGEVDVKVTSPKRGEILDRNKMPLAMNDTVYQIGIIPEKMGDNKEQIIQQVASILGLSTESIEKSLNEDWVQPHLFVPLKKIPKSKENTLDSLWKVDSVVAQEVTGRIYPLGEAASHLIGYVGTITAEELEKVEPGTYQNSDFIGKRGLERHFEKKLKGKQGVKIIIKEKGKDDIVLAEVPVKDGETITLTIDANVQERIYNSYEGDAGTAAAIDPKTGETIALISSPGFNPDDLTYGISADQWKAIQDDPNLPLINRFTATFAPGSVMKPISAAIGLKNGTIKPEEALTINGLRWGKKGWGDYTVKRVSSTGLPVDLKDALYRSDNIYFAMQAVKMGDKAFETGLKNFGLEEEFPFEYPMQKSTISTTGKFADEIQVANTSYGQAEVEMSSLHLALSYTPFLNNGKMIKPVLLTSEETGQTWHKDLVTTEQAQLMQDILRGIVEKGTAKAANISDFPISGKTGTAELKLSAGSKGRENGWFVGYPTEKQNLLIAMVIENVQDKGASSYTAKKVAEILYDVAR